VFSVFFLYFLICVFLVLLFTMVLTSFSIQL